MIIRNTILSGENYFSLDVAVEPLSQSRRLLRVRERMLAELGYGQSRYVTMAVFTSTAEEQADPEYASRTLPQETIGVDLAEPVDFLRSSGVDVSMLGFPDSGKAHVPREMPRLFNFAKVGGLHEAALASGCLYFWADCVGAQWLREPFKRSVLVTNLEDAIPKSHNIPHEVSAKYLLTIRRYRTLGGNLWTLREIFSYKSCFEDVAPGESEVRRSSRNRPDPSASRNAVAGQRNMVNV